MDPDFSAERPPLTNYAALAKMIDHSLLRPELTEADVSEGCRLARDYQVAALTVRPADVELAVRLMEDSGVPVGTVAGFPHGSETTATKLYECRDALRRGAREIDMVLNIGKLLSRGFQYVESEIQQMVAACRERDAILKVIFENAYLTDELKIVACRICSRTGAHFVKTSTGFAPTGATGEDLRLMRKHSSPEVKVKAAGGVRTLERALEVYQAGADRFGATATAAILGDWKARLASASAAPG